MVPDDEPNAPVPPPEPNAPVFCWFVLFAPPKPKPVLGVFWLEPNMVLVEDYAMLYGGMGRRALESTCLRCSRRR